MSAHVQDFTVPEALTATLSDLLGEGATSRWTQAAVDTVHRLCAEWDLEIIGPLTGGALSLVLEVKDPNKKSWVLKIPATSDMGQLEVDALGLWTSGTGPEVHRIDLTSGAWLMDYLETQSGEINAFHAHVLADILHLPDIGMARFPLLDDAVQWRITSAYGRKDRGAHPAAEHLDEAVATLSSLMSTTSGTVLLHGDYQAKNILLTPAGPRAIDPMPCRGDRDFDLALWVATSNHSADTATAAAHLSADPSRFAAWAWAMTIIERRNGWPSGPARELYALAQHWRSAVTELDA